MNLYLASKFNQLFIIFLLYKYCESIECISYHKYFEENKVREIVPSTCIPSSGYCVKAIYSDTDPLKMNGISRGCDKNDCIGVNVKAYGWDRNGCKSSKDYGNNGSICCCNNMDRCNESGKLGVPSVFCIFFLCITLTFFKLTHYFL
uniref:Activin_recp domain-containing protein n=1 Tax=Rhabditophanes sp. KR3021 TaxID=114890 RepID=A0AC35U3Y9_9BILA